MILLLLFSLFTVLNLGLLFVLLAWSFRFITIGHLTSCCVLFSHVVVTFDLWPSPMDIQTHRPRNGDMSSNRPHPCNACDACFASNTGCKAKPDCSLPGYPSNCLVIIVKLLLNWFDCVIESGNLFACALRSNFPSCRIPEAPPWRMSQGVDWKWILPTKLVATAASLEGSKKITTDILSAAKVLPTCKFREDRSGRYWDNWSDKNYWKYILKTSAKHARLINLYKYS